jgi:hypothetical protein
MDFQATKEETWHGSERSRGERHFNMEEEMEERTVFTDLEMPIFP